MAESFRHAIIYLAREAYGNGFRLVGTSLEEAERAIDKELNIHGVSLDELDDRGMSKDPGNKLN
jgi:hypothetical protein